MLIRKDLFNQILSMAMNSAEYLNEKEGKWITVKGNHIYVGKGQTEKEAFDAFLSKVENKKTENIKKEEKIDYEWLENKLYALNKFAKSKRALVEINENLDNEGNIYFSKKIKDEKKDERDELYKIKDLILDKYGKYTNIIHKFPKGYGAEYKINNKGSFHKYFNNEYSLREFMLKNTISKLSESEKKDFSFSHDENNFLNIEYNKNYNKINLDKNMPNLSIDFRYDPQDENRSKQDLLKLDINTEFKEKNEIKFKNKIDYYEKSIELLKKQINELSPTQKKKIEYLNNDLKIEEKFLKELKEINIDIEIKKLKELKEIIKKEEIDKYEKYEKQQNMKNKFKQLGYIFNLNNIPKLDIISEENKRNIELTKSDIKKLKKIVNL